MAARRPSAEESALWRAAMRDVRGKTPAVPPAPPAAPEAAPRRDTRHAPEPIRPPPPPPGAGLDRRSALRLRRGEMPIEARLDLHGLTQDEAHRAVTRFVVRMHEAGRRAVLIVTGKGTREGGGVLRQAVPRWLAEPTCRAVILAVSEARPQHGGGGALYVLLRRKR
ncbi:MAG TPA: Smr/MutS family protein [Stellaceae bacterium]|nr:Smr/MutS family protein [Stellaceae bacterium]